MKWLQFGGMNVGYINTGVIPKTGYSISTTIRTSQPVDCGLFGSRSSDGATDSIDCYLIRDYANSKIKFQCDYGTKGKPIELDFQSTGSPKTYSIKIDGVSSVNDKTYDSGRNNVNGKYPIYIGTVNTANKSDGRNGFIDYYDFVIYDSSGYEVFHGIPVEKGNTEYSSTPAPSNCMWDTVSKTYKEKSGGDGVLWIDDTSNSVGNAPSTPMFTSDYGLKVLFDENDRVFNMNSKYRLLGADITSKTSQFKTYDFTLLGDATEPSISFPAYKYDNVYYYGRDNVEREAIVIDTGMSPDTTKVINVEWDEITANMANATGHEYWRDNDGVEFNTYVAPSKVQVIPEYINNVRALSIYTTGKLDKTDVIPIGTVNITLPAMGSINGGSPTFEYSAFGLGIRLSMDDQGRIHVYTLTDVNWYQRAWRGDAEYFFESRLYAWAWLTGLRFRVSVLNTPYKL